MNKSIFKAYDIRGIYPTDINEEKIITITKSIHSLFIKKLKKKHFTIAVGYDMRLSSPSLQKKVVSTLVDLGVTVYDIGLASTPTVYFAMLEYQTDAGIQISASHNPKEYAGLKFAYRSGKIINKISKDTGMSYVRDLSIKNSFEEYKGKKGKLIVKKNTLKKEINKAIEYTNIRSIPKFKIVVDPANAMGVVVFKELFAKISTKLVTMNYTLDGTFPVHQADPLQFNLLQDLQKKVIDEAADFGIAPDGDADRVFFIDERGKIVPATMITALVAFELLKTHPNAKILVDIRYTRNTINMCKTYGGIAVLSKVGHALITEQLNKENAIFAGESSGHYYFRETGGAESSVRVILILMKVLAREKRPLSDIIKKFYTSYESGEYNFILPPNISSDALMSEIVSKYNKGIINRLDGVAIDYPDWRASIRTSNTEPLLRLNVEAESDNLSNKILKEISNLIKKKGGVLK